MCYRVKDVIIECQFDHLGIEEQFSEFPDSITLDQVVDVWKRIVLYQEKLKTGTGNKMTLLS